MVKIVENKPKKAKKLTENTTMDKPKKLTKKTTTEKAKKFTEKTITGGKINKKKPKKNKKKSKVIKVEAVPEEVLQENVTITKKKKKNRYIMPSESVTEKLLKKCVASLFKLAEHQKKDSKIFEEESQIFAEIHPMQIQDIKGNVRFLYPHSTVASTGEVCLVTPDLKKGKKQDHEGTIEHWKDLLEKAGVTAVKTILPMRQLRVEYEQFEMRRRLLTQHDFMMVDTRVLNHVSHQLGKKFFQKHNMVIPVRLENSEKSNLKEAIDIGLRTAMLRLGLGHTTTILVGHTGMPKKAIADNILSLVQQLDKYPGGEANVRSISIKLPLSLSLPVYLTLRPQDNSKPPKLVQKKPKNSMILEDELSTIPGKRVSVAPDGTVKLIKEEDDAEQSEMEVSDNEDKEEEKEEESE